VTGQQPEPAFTFRMPKPDDGPRLRRFQDTHPGTVIELGRHRTWHVAIPEGDGMRFTVRRSLGEIVDRLAELYGEW
jgi:hypothetical protein